MAQFLLPIIFVVLWSSAFVAGKAGVQHATPFAFLAVRFSIVALIFMAVAVGFWIWRSKSTAKAIGVKDRSNDPILQTALVGVLIHGTYLGSTFFAMANGLGAALAALIVSTQPLLTTALAIFLFGEKPRLIQWIGIFIGFAGRYCRDFPIAWDQCAGDCDHVLCFWFACDYGWYFAAKTHWRLDWVIEKQYHSGKCRQPVFHDADCNG